MTTGGFPYNTDYYPRMVFEHFERKDTAFQPLPFQFHDVQVFGTRASKPAPSLLRIDIAADNPSGGGIEGFMERKVSDTVSLVLTEYCRFGAIADIDMFLVGMINSCQYPSEGAWFEKGTSPDTLRAVSADSSGRKTTDNISCSVGAFHKYEVKIKSGHVYFCIDGAQMAHHTANVPYSSTLYSNIFVLSVGRKDVFIEIDYLFETLGISF